MKRKIPACLLFLFIAVVPCTGQIAYANIEREGKRISGLGNSFGIEYMVGRIFFFSGGGYIANSSWKGLDGFVCDANLKIGLGYVDDIDLWGAAVGVKGGGEFDDFNPEMVGYAIGGWGYFSLNQAVSMNLDYTYGFNTKSRIYHGSLNIYILSLNVTYIEGLSGRGYYIFPGLIFRPFQFD